MQDEIKNSIEFENVLKNKIKELNLSFDEIEKQLNKFHINIVKGLQINDKESCKIIEEELQIDNEKDVEELLSDNGKNIEKLLSYDGHIIEELQSDDVKYIDEYNLQEIFLTYCVEGNLEKIKKFYENNKQNNLDLDKTFKVLSKFGDLDIIKWLYSFYKPNLKILSDAFIISSNESKLDFVKWLYSIISDKTIIHNEINNLFCKTIIHNEINMAKWFYYSCDIKPNIYIDNGDLFIAACMSGNIEIVKWLKSLCDDIFEYKLSCRKSIINKNGEDVIIDGVVDFKMAELYKQKNFKKIILILNFKEEFNLIGSCLTCYSDNIEISTPCNHCFCLDCFLRWYIIDVKNDCYKCNKFFLPSECFIKKGITFEDDSIIQNDINNNQIEI